MNVIVCNVFLPGNFRFCQLEWSVLVSEKLIFFFILMNWFYAAGAKRKAVRFETNAYDNEQSMHVEYFFQQFNILYFRVLYLLV